MSVKVKFKDGICKIKIEDDEGISTISIDTNKEKFGSFLSSTCQLLSGLVIERDMEENKKKKKEKDRFGKYFTEAQVEEWADKIRAKNTRTTREELKDIKKMIREKKFHCSVSETMLHTQFNIERVDFKSPKFDPCKAGEILQSDILLVSECLRRPGRSPGTNPDEINKPWSFPWPWH